MPKGNSSVHPVKVLGETITALEAAVLECVAKPGTQAVHKVRTTTRRIEAQINLLPLIGGFPPYEDEAEKMRRLLKKLRRAAGAVRDVDVQKDLVAKEQEALPDSTAPAARKEAGKLLHVLSKRRDRQAARLEKLLRSAKKKIPKRAKALTDALEPAASRAISEAELVSVVRVWYRKQAQVFQAHDRADPDHLHGVRKIAKLARYLAETAPKRAHSAHALAERFETLQESGGQWHDWLILSEVAASELGEAADLPQRFGTHAGEALADFQKKLRYRM